MLVADVTFHDDDPAPRVAWLRTHAGALADMPHPGHGRTGERLRILATIAAADGSLGRLAEGHLDAIAIMTELVGAVAGDDRLRGVWAARPESAGRSTDIARLAPRRQQAVVLRRRPHRSGAGDGD